MDAIAVGPLGGCENMTGTHMHRAPHVHAAPSMSMCAHAVHMEHGDMHMQMHNNMHMHIL